MRLLVLDEAAQQRIQRVVQHATRPERWYRPDKDSRIPGDDPQFVVHIPDGYRCVFTITKAKGQTLRHLSISVPAEDKYPNVVAAFLIAKEFGFTGWDEKTVDALPPGWMSHVNQDEHCVVLGQEYKP